MVNLINYGSTWEWHDNAQESNESVELIRYYKSYHAFMAVWNYVQLRIVIPKS